VNIIYGRLLNILNTKDLVNKKYSTTAIAVDLGLEIGYKYIEIKYKAYKNTSCASASHLNFLNWAKENNN
jgi:hypothetical protein